MRTEMSTGMKVIKMELGEPDASGRRRPVEIAGSEYEIEVDTVIMSLGTSPNPLICFHDRRAGDEPDGNVSWQKKRTGQTSKAGVYRRRRRRDWRGYRYPCHGCR